MDPFVACRLVAPKRRFLGSGSTLRCDSCEPSGRPFEKACTRLASTARQVTRRGEVVPEPRSEVGVLGLCGRRVRCHGAGIVDDAGQRHRQRAIGGRGCGSDDGGLRPFAASASAAPCGYSRSLLNLLCDAPGLDLPNVATLGVTAGTHAPRANLCRVRAAKRGRNPPRSRVLMLPAWAACASPGTEGSRRYPS